MTLTPTGRALRMLTVGILVGVVVGVVAAHIPAWVVQSAAVLATSGLLAWWVLGLLERHDRRVDERLAAESRRNLRPVSNVRVRGRI